MLTDVQTPFLGTPLVPPKCTAILLARNFGAKTPQLTAQNVMCYLLKQVPDVVSNIYIYIYIQRERERDIHTHDIESSQREPPGMAEKDYNCRGTNHRRQSFEYPCTGFTIISTTYISERKTNDNTDLSTPISSCCLCSSKMLKCRLLKWLSAHPSIVWWAQGGPLSEAEQTASWRCEPCAVSLLGFS